MSKLNIIIECIEKNNTVENSVTMVVSTFINVLHNLQWVPNTCVFFVCCPSTSYQVSNLLGSVLQTTRWTDHCWRLNLNHIFLLLFHWTSTFMDQLSWFYCFVCMLYDAKKNTIYHIKIMRKERKSWHDKNRFHDKIMCLLCYVLYNTYAELSSLFSCQCFSCLCVGGCK